MPLPNLALDFSGLVIPGNGLGGTMGFRTANIATPQVHPDLFGTYTTTVRLQDARVFHGVSNLGAKPTIGADRALLEVHIFDFDEEIYGARLWVTLHERLRRERSFESIEALQTQLAEDVRAARALLGRAAADDRQPSVD